MSDEDVTFGDGDEGFDANAGDYEAGEFTPEMDPALAADDSTPEGKYRSAKDYIGFDDMQAVCMFYDVYNDESAEVPLRMRALQRAAVVLAQHDDVDQIMQALELVFACHECQWLESVKCQQTIQEMLANVVRSEELYTQFLEKAAERVDRNTQIHLFLDLKLRQCEMMMKNADYDKAREYMTEAEQFCPLPPDSSDASMCHSAIRLLILKIEFADFEGNEDAMFDYYAQAQAIPKQSLAPRQTAVLTQIEGLQAFGKRDFRTARAKFYDAFTAFNELGSDKRIKCLPYCSLASMLLHEVVSIFMAPEVMNFKNHPVVAPLAQLNEAYQRSDIVLFNSRIPSAQKVFKSPFYDGLIDEVRRYVLSGAVKNFCPTFNRVSLSYIAKELESPEPEVTQTCYNLILRGSLNGLVDPSSNMYIKKKPFVPSPYLANTNELLARLEALVRKSEKNTSQKLRA